MDGRAVATKCAGSTTSPSKCVECVVRSAAAAPVACETADGVAAVAGDEVGGKDDRGLLVEREHVREQRLLVAVVGEGRRDGEVEGLLDVHLRARFGPQDYYLVHWTTGPLDQIIILGDISMDILE